MRRSALFLPVVIALVCILASPAGAATGQAYRVTDVAAGGLDAGAVRAAAISKELWLSDRLNAIANDVAATTDMQVLVEDDPAEWASFLGAESPNVLGFTSITEPVLYHRLLLSPSIYPVFGAWLSTGSPVGIEYPFSVSAMTLIHESFHWRLLSSDESAVNACALKYFPYYVERDFGVPATISQTTTQQVPVTTTETVPVSHVKIIKRRVKLKGRWVTHTTRTKVTRYVTRTKTSYETQAVTTDVPNPLFQTLVADAGDFYANGQPPPYNSGVCPV
jgi:hypothetical protein